MINLITQLEEFKDLKVPNKELIAIYNDESNSYKFDTNKEVDRLLSNPKETRERSSICKFSSDGKLAEILIKELFLNEFIEVNVNSLIKCAANTWLDLNRNIEDAIKYHDLIHVSSGEIVEIKRWNIDAIEQKLKLFKEKDCKNYNFSHWMIICSYDKTDTWIHSIERLR
jgi:hypothetical protein